MKSTWIIIVILVIGILVIALIAVRPNQVIAPEDGTTASTTVKESVPVVQIPLPVYTALNTPTVLTVSKKIEFADGLIVTLENISDSRCKQGVQCIWAGELSAQFSVTGGNFGNTSANVQLGTTNSISATTYGYTFTLVSATETKAVLTVSKTPQ